MKKGGCFVRFIREYFNNRELNQLFSFYSFRYFASSLASLFVPVYLLTIGYRLLDISLFYLIFFTSVVILMPFAMLLLSKIGVKKVLVLGTLFLAGYYPMLYLLDKGLPYPWAAMIFGLSIALEASAFNMAFTSFLNKKNEGKGISVLRALGITAGIAGPVIGGIIIFNFSYKFAFAVTSGILIISVIPLLLSKDFKINHERFNIKKIVKQDSFRNSVVHQINAALMIIGGIFWPIFIYLNVKNVIPLGIISSLTSFLMIFMIIYIGRKADEDEEGTLKLGVYLNAPSWLVRLFFLSPMGLFFTNFYGSFSDSLIDISFSKMIFENARKSKSRRDYFLFREVNLLIGRAAILIIAILAGNIFWMFLISFFVTFGYLLLIKGRKIHRYYKEKMIAQKHDQTK